MTRAWIAVSPPALEAGSVHVWKGRVEASAADAVWPLLARDERVRADRFHRPGDRHRFVMGRGGARALLAAYTGCAPHRLAFAYGPRGKPYLQATSIRFNVSHAGGVVLWAFARDARVGVDVEQVGEPDEEIKQAVLAPRERAWIDTLNGSARAEAFYRCWTLKEALVKATGEGFVADPVALDVRRAACGEASHAQIGCQDFSLQSVPVGSGYVAAVAVEGAALRTRLFVWEPGGA